MASKQSDEQSIVEQKVHEAAVCRLDFLSSNLSSLCREKKKKDLGHEKILHEKSSLSPFFYECVFILHTICHNKYR